MEVKDGPQQKGARWIRVGTLVGLSLLTLMLAGEIAMTLQWRLGHDTSILHYAAFLIDVHGCAPYRDVFDMSMPGTILFHLGIGRLFGYESTAFMVLDVVWLAAFTATTYAIMRPLGSRVAWAGGVLFGLLYLGYGRGMVLQRDVVLILPIAVSILVFRRRRPAPGWRALCYGLLVGASMTFKPHAGLALAVLLAFEFRRLVAGTGGSRGSMARTALVLALPAAAGAAVPVGLALAWVSATGGLDAFVEMCTDYLPLYRNLSETHSTLGPGELPGYLLRGTLGFGGQALWLVPAVAGVAGLVRDRSETRENRELVALLAAMAAAMAAYAALGGKFWPYHWMPCHCFTLLLAGLCLRRPGEGTTLLRRAGLPAVLAVAIAIGVRPPYGTRSQLENLRAPAWEGARIDQIAAFLSSRMEEGDRVQPLDWTGGAVHGMLLARARIATRFMADFHFRHDVAEPVIVRMRELFISEWNAAPPRFVIEIRTMRVYVSGPGTDESFPELTRILERDYVTAKDGDGYRILERRSP